MKKAFTLIIAAAFIVAEPLMAMDAQASSVPKELSNIGVTADDLKDVGAAVVDQPTAAEADIMQRRWRNRYCPRGYRLVVQRIRIGRFIVTRYRCVRARRGRWDDRGRWYNTQSVEQPETSLPTN